MHFPESWVASLRAASRLANLSFVDARGFEGENCDEAGPGGFINPYGYWVVATTIGGNAVVISDKDPGVYFASHDSYSDDLIAYEDPGTGQWHELQWTAENLRRSLRRLAPTREEFLRLVSDPAYEKVLDALD